MDRTKKGDRSSRSPFSYTKLSAVLPFDNLLPLVVDLLFQLRRRFGYRREVFHPLERPASIDNRARVEAFLAWLEHQRYDQVYLIALK